MKSTNLAPEQIDSPINNETTTLSDEALELMASNPLEVGSCVTSTDFSGCGCRK